MGGGRIGRTGSRIRGGQGPFAFSFEGRKTPPNYGRKCDAPDLDCFTNVRQRKRRLSYDGTGTESAQPKTGRASVPSELFRQGVHHWKDPEGSVGKGLPL